MKKPIHIDRLKFVVNGVEIYNNNNYPHIPIGKLISETFCSVPKLEFWSEEALKDFVIGNLELIKLYCQELSRIAKSRAKLTNLIRRIDNHLKFVQKLTREQLLTSVYNLSLSCEGLGTLPHFGMTNRWGDNVQGNPEKMSIYK